MRRVIFVGGGAGLRVRLGRSNAGIVVDLFLLDVVVG